MATVALATLHDGLDCRWSRPDDRVTSAPATALQPASAWTCVREGLRRTVRAADCATCPQWEPRETLATAAPRLRSGQVDASAVTAAPRQLISEEALSRSYRAVMAAIAITFAATGVAVLTSPLAVPLTIALWISAAATVALAALTPGA